MLKIAWHYVFCFHPPSPPETIKPDSKSEIKVVKTVREREKEKEIKMRKTKKKPYQYK